MKKIVIFLSPLTVIESINESNSIRNSSILQHVYSDYLFLHHFTCVDAVAVNGCLSDIFIRKITIIFLFCELNKSFASKPIKSLKKIDNLKNCFALSITYS